MTKWSWRGAAALGVAGLLGCAHGGTSQPGTGGSAGPVKAHVPYASLTSVDAPPLRYHYTPEQLGAECEQAEKVSDLALARLVAMPADHRTFGNTFQAFDDALAAYTDTALRLSFMKDVHPDEKVRTAAAACEERSGKYMVRVGARRDLYEALKGYAEGRGKTDALAAVDQRLIFLTLRDFRRNGLELSDADRQKLVTIRSRLAELATQFESHLDENTDAIEATPAELAGMPASFLKRLKKAPDGKLIVTIKYPDYYPVMENARSEALRRRLDVAFMTREAKRNLPLLQEAISLRDQAAKLLGFKTHADFVTEPRMAKNAAAVASFLSQLREELKPGREALQQKLLGLKIAETHNKKAVVRASDWRYYLKQLKQRDYALNDEQIRTYFPADKVVAGMFDVYSKVLHVSFVEVKGADVWAPGVKLFEVHDMPSNKLLAKFYTDFFPREGKYGHAANFGLTPARELAQGYQVPLTALVSNFEPPEPGHPSYLSVSEVEVLFHEFGHVMHNSLTTVPFAYFSGSAVETDFVEAPSQMLENWVYQPEVLKLISEDPKHPGQPIPAALAKSVAAARTYDSGIRYSRQNYLATTDQEIHTGGANVDPDAVEHRVWKTVMAFPLDGREHMVAGFGHLMNGYDAGYYGYLWSQVFAEDMFTRFESEGILNGDTGRAYRDIILARGGSEEPDQLLKQFLGRAPNEKAFLRIMGVTPAPAPVGTAGPSSTPSSLQTLQ